MKSVIIIRGPLGVGKSTVAKEISKKIGGLYISIDDILEKYGLDKDSDGEGVLLENFLKTNEIALKQIEKALEKDKNVVIDGNFYHKEQVENLLDLISISPYVFTLKATVEICLERDSDRPKSYGEGATRAVHTMVARFDYGINIETDNQSIDETVDDIMSKL